jgi:hypothetical protein
MRTAIINSLVLVLLSGVAYAGALATDANALVYDSTTWRGTTVMVDSNNPDLKANVDYCVYGPGQFSYPGLGYTPTSDEFVYAYQVFIEGSTEVLNFAVTLGASNGANNVGSWTMTGGVAPDESGIGGGEVNWGWDDGLHQGEESYGLAFSSPHAPTWDSGAIINGGGAASNDVPSPSDVIPEPTTLGLLLVGAIVGGWRRRRHG